MPFRLLRSGRINRLSLKIKIPTLSAIILTVVFGVAAVILIRNDIESEKQALLAKARSFSELSTQPIGNAYESYFHSGYFRFREILIDLNDLNLDITRIQIIGVEGDILYDTIHIDTPLSEIKKAEINEQKVLNAVQTNKTIEFKNQNGDINEIVVPYTDDFGIRPFSIRYFVSYESIYQSINNTIISVSLLALAALIVTFAVMTYMVHRSVLSPLGRIVNSAKLISRGNLEKAIHLESKDELGDLAQSLNQMTDILKKNIEDLKKLDKLKDEFILLASHNLRTPLTSIKGYLDTLLSSKSIEGADKESLLKVTESTQMLESTTESLINLVSLEKENIIRKKAIDMTKIIESVVNSLVAKANEKNIKISLDFPEKPLSKINVDSRRIHQALFGLVENSIKFNKDNGNVIIKAFEKSEKLRIEIIDTGIGISNKEKDLVFQKFHRATDTLTYDYEGIGLGLYLTKLIIEAHQGKIWFDSVEDKGTTFYIELPFKEGEKGD